MLMSHPEPSGLAGQVVRSPSGHAGADVRSSISVKELTFDPSHSQLIKTPHTPIGGQMSSAAPTKVYRILSLPSWGGGQSVLSAALFKFSRVGRQVMNKFEFRRFTPRRKFLSFDTSGAKDDFEKHEPRSRPRMTVRIRFLTAVVAYQRSHSRAEGSQKCTSALCVQLLQRGRRQTGIGPEQFRAAMRLDVAQRLRRDLLPVAGERPRVDAHDALIGGVAGGRAAVLCEPGRTLAEADAAEVADPAHRPLGVQRQRL